MPPQDNNNPNDQAPAPDPLNPVPPAGGQDDGALPVNHDDPAAGPAPDPGLGVPPAVPPEDGAPADPLGGGFPPAPDDGGVQPPAEGQNPDQAL